MTFQPTTDRYGDLDIRPLAEELAKLLDGKATLDHEATWFATIAIGDIELNLYRKRDMRFEASANAKIPAAVMRARSLPTSPRASFDAKRPLATLAKEIKRRVLDASAEVIAKQKAIVADEAERQVNLASAVETLRKVSPAVSINTREGDATADFYLNHKGAYLYGNVYPDGSLSVQRCGSIPADRLAAVIRALTGEA